ncbi:MAG: ABC transporter ATP-binding protein [Deltaproteobacteria bacterium]|nr:ABC transporter ATP-binding protein [Deltaproteobacteria bacterium]
MFRAIVVRDLTVGYNRHPAVHHLSGRFEPGTLTAVVGPNGSGKSTLLKAIMGILRPMDGTIDLDGLKAGQLAYLPQQAEIDHSFPINVLDMVALGHWPFLGPFGRVDRDQWAKTHAALAAVGLVGFERRPIGSLSAGQFQRVLFARLFLQDAPVILLDEPFTAVDTKTTEDLLGVVLEWIRLGRTVVAVIHDLDQVRTNFPYTLMLARKPIAWGPTSTILTPDNLDMARCIAEAWDQNAPVCHEKP